MKRAWAPRTSSQFEARIAFGVNNAVSWAASLLAIAVFGIVVAAAFEHGHDD